MRVHACSSRGLQRDKWVSFGVWQSPAEVSPSALLSWVLQHLSILGITFFSVNQYIMVVILADVIQVLYIHQVIRMFNYFIQLLIYLGPASGSAPFL